MKKVNLSHYVTVRGGGYRSSSHIALYGYREGQKVAKELHVNKMVVEVDRATLAEN